MRLVQSTLLCSPVLAQIVDEKVSHASALHSAFEAFHAKVGSQLQEVMVANDRRARPTCQKSKRPRVTDAPVGPIEDARDDLKKDAQGDSKSDTRGDVKKDAPAAPATKEAEVEPAQQPGISETHIWEISDGESSDGLRVWAGHCMAWFGFRTYGRSFLVL